MIPISDLRLRVILVVVISLGLACLGGCSKPTDRQRPNDAQSPALNVRSSADVVKVSTPNLSISVGGKADAIIALSISPGYHVNANPATFDYLIATNVTAGKSEGLSTGKPVYPAAEKKKFQFAEAPLAVYEGEVQIKLPLTAAANASGVRSLPVDVRVQACDQEKCFPPDTLHTTLAVEVK